MTRLHTVRMIRKALWGWQCWRMRRQREAAFPALRAQRLRREALQRQHRKGVAAVDRETRRLMQSALSRFTQEQREHETGVM